MGDGRRAHIRCPMPCHRSVLIRSIDNECDQLLLTAQLERAARLEVMDQQASLPLSKSAVQYLCSDDRQTRKAKSKYLFPSRVESSPRRKVRWS